ncbi:minor capsid protein [Pseudonocardia sp. McavD-2-B]|uniref:minor capsid protein n=1 Tax=Pseudonocardia sp. McavD-2-B TaxID=2954499 RepID=UPI0020985AF0|nr:minor capsid protein [Pseudonocardia sp. McavD-2-B]MCO7196896.1 minor capsid protein [Pseudonocardia sp. McavD-2-B]
MTAPENPPSLSEEFAELLDELGVATYDPAGVGGNVFVLGLPADPDLAVRVATYAGVESDSKHGYDEPNVQVWVRGPRGNPVAAERLAQRVYLACHGLRPRTLPGGTPVLSCIGNQAGPIYVGPDEHGRHELSVNFRVELRRRGLRNRT